MSEEKSCCSSPGCCIEEKAARKLPAKKINYSVTSQPLKQAIPSKKMQPAEGGSKANEEKTCCSSSGSCCGAEPLTPYSEKDTWVTGVLPTPKGGVPIVSTKTGFKEILGAWKVRWGVGRMNYRINPGIYAVGSPDQSSPVLVSANYKLTFDALRKELSGLNCWLLILDTKGVNVWCAAGKGTFGTDELINRISKTGLAQIISHKKLILPQLGAVGVAAHEVAKQTGLSVVYGPVRAKDIKEFLSSGCIATESMRTVWFTAGNRLVLTPLQLVQAAKLTLMVFGALFILNLFAARPFGLHDFIIGAGVVVVGAVLTPLLLPFIPGRAFAWKGWLLGAIWTAAYAALSGWFAPGNLLLSVGYLLVLPALSAYIAMDFTGSSTYTSFSGVTCEMKISLPFIIALGAAGTVLVLVKSFMG